MIKSPKFSIIIPVYNVEKYLSICLNSVIKQTLKDIEIICVNDGSKDNSADILELYKAKDSRIKVVEKQNGGLSSARNEGLKYAQGEYILFLDSDDYFQSNTCERLYQEVIERKPDIIVFGANLFPIYPAPEWWYVNNLSPKTGVYKGKPVHTLLHETGAYPFIWRDCIKRSFLEECKLEFNEVIKYAEDTIFQFCLFPFADCIVFISDHLYNYRWTREGSLMDNAAKDLGKKYSWHIEAVRIIAEYWKKKGLLNKYGEYFFDWSVSFTTWDLYKYKGPDKIELVNRLFSVWKDYDLLKYRNKLSLKQKFKFYCFSKMIRKE